MEQCDSLSLSLQDIDTLAYALAFPIIPQQKTAMSTGTRYPDQDFQNNPNTTPSSNPNTTGNMHTLMPNTSDQVHHEAQAPPIGRNTSSGSDEDAFDDDEDDDEDDDVEEDYNDLADALSWDSTKHSASSSEGSSVPSQHHDGPGSFHRSGDKATSAPVSSTLSATSGVVASRKEKLTFQELSKYFEMPFFKVCKRVNVCETILKKLCRKLGIPRWPHRKVGNHKTKTKNTTSKNKNRTRRWEKRATHTRNHTKQNETKR